MKNLLISVALAGIFAAAPALAQGHDDHHEGPHGGPPPGHAGGPGPSGPRPGGAAMRHDAGGPDRHMEAPRPPAAAVTGPPAAAMRHEDRGQGPRPGPAFAGPAPRQDNRASGPRFAPTVTGPSRAGRSNFNAYHRAFNAPRRFHAPSYRRPSGWYAHRWTFGEILPQLFWAQNYWIDDFTDYDLMPPPPGTVWVRDGADALLIDRYSGEVIQVVYDVFY